MQLEEFHKLGDKLEGEWRSVNYDERLFPALAGQALSAARLPERYTPWQVLEWTIASAEMPRQRDIPGRFGEPPITIYSASRFHIDVYFWFHGTTSTHQHAFCGAFQVMHGSSIHSSYDFEVVEKINSFCEIGEMRLKTCELLKAGDVQEILPGRQYIHGLFHLDHPSATIVVRTDKSPLFLPQFDYHKPGLATDPFFEDATLTKKIQAMQALLRAKRPDADDQIARLIGSSDLHSAYMVLSSLYDQMGSDAVGQMFGDDREGRRFDRLLSIIVERNTAHGEMFRNVFAHRDRVNDLVRRRSFVDNPEHRYFLALLLNVEGGEHILSLIRDRFADADPIEKILDWAYELSQVRLAGQGDQNALGISPFDDFDLQLLEYLLRGKSDGEMADIIREIYPAEKAEQMLPTLSDRTAGIRNSIAFSPLLSGT